jgi:hypothetical protein
MSPAEDLLRLLLFFLTAIIGNSEIIQQTVKKEKLAQKSIKRNGS